MFSTYLLLLVGVSAIRDEDGLEDAFMGFHRQERRHTQAAVSVGTKGDMHRRDCLASAGQQSQHWGNWNAEQVSKHVSKWPTEKLAKLKRMASKTMWEVLQYSAIPQDAQGKRYFVQAGELPQMWLRDSTASLHHLFTTGAVDRNPRALKVTEGLARSLAAYIKKDNKCSAWEPYDNGAECRGGGIYTDMRFELDSPMYVLRMLRLLKAHGSNVTSEDDAQHAAAAIVQLSQKLMGYDFLLSTESRPSDDPAIGGFNIPDNFFAAVELSRLHEFVKNPEVVQKASQLSKEIMKGITRFGTKAEPGFGRVFCYEATRSECLIMDDANVPSLMALPYLDDASGLLDQETYGRTRCMLLSTRNRYYYTSQDGNISGIGSPHVPGKRVWPMSMVSRALTAKDPREVADMLDMLVRTDSGKELMHESVNVDDPHDFTRPWFDWPNALFAELVDRCCNDLVGTRTNPMPADIFSGWQTCGFRDGMCSLKGTTFSRPDTGVRVNGSMLAERHISRSKPNDVCARFGTPFNGFFYKRVNLFEFPVHCTKDFFGVEQNGAFHCALAEAASCPSDVA